MKLFGHSIIFAQAHNWWVFAVIALMIAIAIIGWYRRSIIIRTLSVDRWRDLLLQGYSPGRFIVKLVLLILGLIALGFVFLQPQWGEKKQHVEQRARDIIIALDISRSMLVQDIEPNRLEAAKNKIKELIEHLPAERIGLVLFAGSSIVQCPLTTDYRAFRAFLDQVGSDTISQGSTSIASALNKIIDIFADQPRSSKVVVMLTDGEDFSEDLSAIKARAQKEGVALVTLGIGTAQGGPIPCIDAKGACTGYQKNDEGSIILSKLDESLLKDIANAVGGMYMRVHEGDADCKAIARYVAQFERALFDAVEMEELENRYAWFAAVALIALLLEWLL